MIIRRELISNALHARFTELCGDRIPYLKPDEFGPEAEFVAEMQRRTRNAPGAVLADSTPGLIAHETWMGSEGNCLTSLQNLCLGGKSELYPGQQPPVASFLKQLVESRADPALSFQLLTARYTCPLNVTLPAEVEISEYLLQRLMVQYRMRLEKQSLEPTSSDDLLLTLNLVAISAALTTDLRFLDALNYYYESLPPKGLLGAQHHWLLVSYLGLYACALATRF